MRKPFTVGIDPGTSTGVGVLRNSDNKVMAWVTKDFFSVQEFIENTFEGDRERVRIYVEHPPKFIYGRNRGKEGSERDHFMGDAGGNRREAQLLFESLRRQGWDVELVAPVREKKWDAQRFRLFTGSANRANQHEMDAVRLAVYYANKR